jgi:hypothetical protein
MKLNRKGPHGAATPHGPVELPTLPNLILSQEKTSGRSISKKLAILHPLKRGYRSWHSRRGGDHAGA